MEDAERQARELRAESRAQREDVEMSVAELEASTRSLSDVLIDRGRRGDPVRIETVRESVTGSIRHVGSDLVGIEIATGARLDIALAHVVGVRPARSASGSPRTPVTTGHPHTLVALLRQLVQGSQLIEVTRIAGASVQGVVDGVSESHVELREGGRARQHNRATMITIVPLTAVVWVNVS